MPAMRMLLRGLEASGVGVLYYAPDLSVLLAENLPASWPAADVVKASGTVGVFDPYTAERIVAAKREVLATGTPARLEVPQFRPGEEPLWFELTIEQDPGANGGVSGLFVSVVEITQLKKREETLRALLFEVSHRSRNMLAILQSVLGQTARHSGSIAEFEEKFRGRIASLAQSQDLITFANWQGVHFRRLAETQIAAYLDGMEPTLRLFGGNPRLSPNTALHLGLAVHELAVNSRTFGAFSDGRGNVRLGITEIEGGRRMEWVETLERPCPEVAAWGFGQTVLEHVVPRAVRGIAHFTVAPRQVDYSIELPEESGGSD